MTTYWAIRRRELAKKDAPAAVVAEPVALAEVVEAEPEPEAEEELSYRDLQAKAKELDIPANQSADDLRAAIESA